MIREEEYIGFPPEIRITHNLHLFFFITIALSGFYISEPFGISGLAEVKWVRFSHTISAIFLYATFIFRIYYAFAGANYIQYLPRKEDVPKVGQWIKYYLFLREAKPVQRKYNPLQKMTYATLISLLVSQALLGMALLDSEGFGFVLSFLGGRQQVRVLHFFVAVALTSIVALHFYLVFTYADQRMRESMFALGRVRERE